MRMIIKFLGVIWRMVIAVVVVAAIAGALIARYFLRLVSSTTKIFAP